MPSRISQTFLSPAAVCRFVLTAAIGLILDLWSKNAAVADLKNADPFIFIRGWLQFEYIENPGAVFGIAPGRTSMFIIVSIAAIIFLTYLFYTSAGKAFYQVILGMLMAGVLGNMYDRILIGRVRDMIHALPGWRWPAGFSHALHLQSEVFPYIFNVADSLLCTGVALMLIYSFFNTGDEVKTKPVAQPAA